MEWKGDDVLKTGSVRDVVCASVGGWTETNSVWGGLYIRDPLSTPKSSVTMFVDGIDSLTLSVSVKPQKMYKTVGDSETIPADFDIWDSEKPSDDIVNVDLEKVDEHVSFTKYCLWLTLTGHTRALHLYILILGVVEIYCSNYAASLPTSLLFFI